MPCSAVVRLVIVGVSILQQEKKSKELRKDQALQELYLVKHLLK
jgi:hypothetical protein